MFSDVSWLAIDLSAPSLAYAARQSRELGLAHVSFARGDLLELVDRTFDVVVSAGVLHHLDDPLAGLRALRDLTAPGGVMLIALYSTLARRELVPARAFATRGQFGVSPAELRRYRADVLALPSSPDTSWRDGLLRRDDFYSLSMLRDLIFHVRETCFTVARIEAALKALDLRFRGFSVNPDIRRRFQARFGAQADPTSLQQWASFETENPDTFWHMYHFMAERA
jgi:SAM-dependent methyltransferase